VIPAGQKTIRVALDNPGAAVPDGEGGYTEGWAALDPAETWANIRPATARDAERLAGGTVLSTRTFVITIDYHPGITTATRVRFHDYHAGKDRTFQVSSVQNPDEAYRDLVITADETTAT
jgi:head-tail adaptor